MKFKKNPFHNRINIETKKLSDDRSYTIREYRDRYFFPDEWVCFFDELNPDRQKPTFHFLINTGARINEARHVKVKDVDFSRKNIVFRWTKSRNKDGSRRLRTITISSQFAKYLKKQIRKKKLGLEDDFKLLSTPAANLAMNKALKKAGIPDYKMFSVHNVRKTTEMYLGALNIPEGKIAKHMGHSEAVAQKFYVSPEIFDVEDIRIIRNKILGDLYLNQR